MKRLFIFIFCLSLCFCCSCSKNSTTEISAEKQAHLASVDKMVSNEISNYEDYENFDLETIKTLSVILRTNIEKDIAENQISISNDLEIIDDDIYNIVKETSGEIIKDSSEENSPDFSIDNKPDTKEWYVEIKKSTILDFLNKNDIKLSSLSNPTVINDEYGFAQKLVIGGKEIDFEYFKTEFNLPSNKIIDINNNLSHIKITGIETSKKGNFEIDFIKSLSNQGFDYKNIIKSKNNSFKIINNA